MSTKNKNGFQTKSNGSKNQIPSVNFHLWEPCNMRCKFCFATFRDVKTSILPKGHLPKEQAIQVVKELAQSGFKKITFVGGEPTLCPWLSELIKEAKNRGLTTMIVTNGTNLTEEFLLQNNSILDWITISIDSINDQTNLLVGRAVAGKRALSLSMYKDAFDRIKKFDYKLKINTVVTKLNYKEQLNEIICYAKPVRWKIFQVLPIIGENDLHIDALKITDKQFQDFLNNHSKLDSITKIIPENNSQMRGSYVMVDPAGRLFENTNGVYHYSEPILDIGVEKALKQVNYNFNKFISREGNYDWE